MGVLQCGTKTEQVSWDGMSESKEKHTAALTMHLRGTGCHFHKSTNIQKLDFSNR